MQDARAEIAATLMDVASFKPSACITTAKLTGKKPITISSTVGFGIDADTSEAAYKAVRDALDRTITPTSSRHQLHVLLGVPFEQHSQVNVARLTCALPSDLRVKTVLQPGGLMMPTAAKTAVVACLTLEFITEEHQSSPGILSPPPVRTVSQSPLSSPANTSPHGFYQPQEEPPKSPSPSNASNSMEMLAQVTFEMMQRQRTDSSVHSVGRSDDSDDGNPTGTFKKLPPGKTPKNHNRLFVKHVYRDYSHEVPMPDEASLAGPDSPERTPNAAFPLKLHEILSQIERNNDDHIVGWLSHGRSFKIHNQEEFVNTVLPKYFVMTKKSSFLRQLNLYGFHRLSKAGPDQGSYYHEKFLRGMKFLSRRMQRQKVNGNGIRAAGNPDEEPNLSRFPKCPPAISANEQAQREVSTVATPAVEIVPATPPVPEESCMETLNDQAPLAPITAPPPLGSFQSACFPLKLQCILDKLEAENQTKALSWLHHGRAFLVRDVDRFVQELAPAYFSQSKYSSFQRQLHMYCFQRITAGPDKGAYYHQNFQRGRPDLAVQIQRTRVNGKGVRKPGNPAKEPNLHSLPPLPPVRQGTAIEMPLDLPMVVSSAGDSVSTSSGTED